MNYKEAIEAELLSELEIPTKEVIDFQRNDAKNMNDEDLLLFIRGHRGNCECPYCEETYVRDFGE